LNSVLLVKTRFVIGQIQFQIESRRLQRGYDELKIKARDLKKLCNPSLI
jgi:hypothetical protein